jgi:Domain of unknown function (DUF1772)
VSEGNSLHTHPSSAAGTDTAGTNLLLTRQGVDSAPVIARFLALCSTVMAGLLAGGMILIDVVLLPFWRGVPPEQFRTWFAAHSDRIRTLMIPLGAGAAAVNAASAVVQAAKGPRAGAASVAAAAAAGVVAITVTVNEPMNHRFTAEHLTDAETANLLARWARWHRLRVALGVLATLGAALTLMDRKS